MLAGMTVLSPIKPSIMTDFFASRAANQTMRCDDFQLNAIPKVPSWRLVSVLCHIIACLLCCALSYNEHLPLVHAKT